MKRFTDPPLEHRSFGSTQEAQSQLLLNACPMWLPSVILVAPLLMVRTIWTGAIGKSLEVAWI